MLIKVCFCLNIEFQDYFFLLDNCVTITAATIPKIIINGEIINSPVLIVTETYSLTTRLIESKVTSLMKEIRLLFS